VTLDHRRPLFPSKEAGGLTAREYALVEFLGWHRGEVVTRTQLYDILFDEMTVAFQFAGRARFQCPEKLGAEFIATRRGQRYCIEDENFQSIKWRLQFGMALSSWRYWWVSV